MALEHTVTWEQVRDRAALRPGTGPGQIPADGIQAEATRLLEVAVEALTGALEDPAGNPVTFRPLPVEDLNECILTVAKAYADRKRTPGTNAQTTTVEDGTGRNVPRDPLAGVRAILARYTVGLA
jgi:hypothetical protein